MREYENGTRKVGTFTDWLRPHKISDPDDRLEDVLLRKLQEKA